MKSIIKYIILSIVLSIAIMPVSGQKIDIGQKVPDVSLHHVLNYSSTKLNLSDFRGKLIILAFWSTNCISCLEEFSSLDSLQKRYGSKVQIIGVNTENKQFTESFIERRKGFLNPSFPLITSDTILSEFFPHKGEPFHVWIDSAGTVKYLMDGYNTTAEHIDDYLLGKEIGTQKHIGIKNYVNTLVQDKWKNNLLYYSYISHCIADIHIGSGSTPTGYIRFSANCKSAIELYIKAFNEMSKYNFDKPWRLNLKIKDTFRFMRPHNRNLIDSWLNKYSYDYDLLLPVSMKDRKYKIMQQDLTRYFGLKARIEKQDSKCWVLVRTSHKDKLHTNGGTPKDNFMRSSITSPIDDSIRVLNNQPYKRFSGRLKNWIQYKFSMPYFDATDYKGNIDINIEGTVIDSLNIYALNKALRRYGLKLVKKDQPIEVLTIKEE